MMDKIAMLETQVLVMKRHINELESEKRRKYIKLEESEPDLVQI